MAMLTLEQVRALSMVPATGADVFSYGLACKLREIEKEFPGLVMIGKAQAKVADRPGYHQPYFGVQLTEAGRRIVEEKTNARII